MSRGEEISRPNPWIVRSADRQASIGWRQLLTQISEGADRAWVAITSDPRRTEDRQHRLHGELALVCVAGGVFEQWQYEASGAARVWYAIDDENRTLWITHAGVGHPKRTDTRGRR